MIPRFHMKAKAVVYVTIIPVHPTGKLEVDTGESVKAKAVLLSNKVEGENQQNLR